MAVTLYTAKRAAELYLGGATAATFHKEVRREFENVSIAPPCFPV